MEIEKFKIKLRLVEEKDAGFILALRTNETKSKYISNTKNDLETQVNWIRAYKKREEAREEFYFIASDSNNEPFATYRIYNKKKDTIEIGSFISKPGYENSFNIVRLDILIKDFVFSELNYNKLNFEVRKKNKSVVKYHKKFQPEIIGEDNLNFYFELSKESFYQNLKSFEKILY